MKRHHSKIQEIINPNEVFSLIGLKKHLIDGKNISDFDAKSLDNRIEKKAPPKEPKTLVKWAAYNICKPVRRPKLLLNSGSSKKVIYNHSNLSDDFFEVSQIAKPQLEYANLKEAKIISALVETPKSEIIKPDSLIVPEELSIQEPATIKFASIINPVLVENQDMEVVELISTISTSISKILVEMSYVYVEAKTPWISLLIWRQRYKRRTAFHIDMDFIYPRFSPVGIKNEYRQIIPPLFCNDFAKYLYYENIKEYYRFLILFDTNSICSISKYILIFYLKQWHFVYLNFKKDYREKPFT